MKNFIEVVDREGKKHLINIQHIEEIAEKDENWCFIYLDVVNNGETQDYYSPKCKRITSMQTGDPNKSYNWEENDWATEAIDAPLEELPFWE